MILTACGGSSSGGDAAPGQPPIVPEIQPPVIATYTIGGGISGLNAAGLVLQNNASDNLTVAADTSSFQFATPVVDGSDYNITVATQPAGLTCTVSRGTGTNVQAAITNVSVVCNANTHTIAGTISGLTTNGLVLRNNGADDFTIAANATTFQFAAPIAAGGGYSVVALTQPTGLTCTVNNGVGNNVDANIHSITIACSAITFTVGGTVNGLTGAGLVLQNNSGDNLAVAANATAFEFSAPIAFGGGYVVAVLTQPAGQYCSIAAASGIASAQVSDVVLTCSEATLTPSVPALALAVNDTGLNAALTGTPRGILITNNGSVPATNLSIDYPTWPLGTSAAAPFCGNTLAAGASCTITITPGQTQSCLSGSTVPTAPLVITVTADDAPTSTVDVSILSYGCVYQGGYIYAIDDTTPDTGSFGGKVISARDQAPAYPNGVVWASNGTNSTAASLDVIPGIAETSTTSSGTPTYSNFTSNFINTYLNTGTYPAPSSNSFSACNGNSDGRCNTSSILTLYNTYITDYGVTYNLSSGPTNSSYYAAGSCSQTIDGYSDWYLPAICELGPDSNGSACSASTQNVVNNLPDLLGDSNAGAPATSCPYGANCLAGYYWSSTQHSSAPANNAWYQYFNTGGGSFHGAQNKSNTFGVRCGRDLTL